MVTLALGSNDQHCSESRSEQLTARVGTVRLNLLDEVGTLLDLTEDDVLAIEPRGDDGGDEELGSVGARASVGHGQEEGAVVTELEVLVGKLVAVDGLSTGTVVVGELGLVLRPQVERKVTYVTTLEHEVGDDSVESRAGVTEAVLAGTELTEVASSLGDNVVEQLEGDSAGGGV